MKRNVNGQNISDSQAIANYFKAHFSNISNSLKSKNSNFAPELYSQKTSFVFQNLNAMDLLKLINKLVNGCNLVSLGLSNIILKIIKFNILTILFNNCLLNGIFPAPLKQGVIIQLYSSV